MCGCRVEIKIIFFDVLAVVSFTAREPKEALFENRITAIPQRQGETDELLAVTDPAQAIFVPAIGCGAGMVVRQIIPGCPVGAIVLTHRAPGTFAEIWSPALPVLLAPGIFL
jgi:hypothetical protein